MYKSATLFLIKYTYYMYLGLLIYCQLKIYIPHTVF